MPQASLLHSGIGDVKAGGSLVPTGTVLAYAGQTSPTGWLVCDGTAYNQSDYADLFSALGSIYNTQTNPTTGLAWAAPSATQFRVPDLRGLFLRGAGTPSGQSTVTVGGHQAQATAKNGLSNSSSSVAASGSTSTDGSHSHTTPGGVQGGSGGFTKADTASQGGPSTNSAGSHSHTVSVSGTAAAQTITGDPETRPMNRGVTYIIKI